MINQTINPMVTRSNNWRRETIAKLKGALVQAVTDNVLQAVLHNKGTGIVQESFNRLRSELSLRAPRPSSLGFSIHDLQYYRSPVAEKLHDVTSYIASKGRRLAQSNGTGTDPRDKGELTEARRTCAAMQAFIDIIDGELRNRDLVAVQTADAVQVTVKTVTTVSV